MIFYYFCCHLFAVKHVFVFTLRSYYYCVKVGHQEKMKPKISSRFDKEAHWPLYDKKSSRSLCKIKSCQNRTHVYCKKCDLHLCFNATRNCFYEYHTQNVDVIESRGERRPKKIHAAKNTRSAVQQACTRSTVAQTSSIASGSMVRNSNVTNSSKTTRNSTTVHVSTASGKKEYCLRRQTILRKALNANTSGSSSNNSIELFNYLKLTRQNI